MMSFTMNDLALLAIALVIGSILGLMMSGRGKFKRLYQEERIAHRTAIKDRDARIDAANSRILELERERPVRNDPVAADGIVGSDGYDNLSRIRGVSEAEERSLKDAGYHRYSQIATLSSEQEATLEARLGLKPGTIAADDWRGQAAALERGETRPGLLGRLTGSH